MFIFAKLKNKVMKKKVYKIVFNDSRKPLMVSSNIPLMEDDVINKALKERRFNTLNDINKIVNVIDVSNE